MDQHQKTRRFGIRVILLACLIRFTSGWPPEAVHQFLTDPETAPLLVYLETGRSVRFSASYPKFSFFRESPAPRENPQTTPVFTREDAEAVCLTYACDARPDIPALLEQRLDWDLTGDSPTVLILHSHATESYTKDGEDYEESSPYRTLEEDHNMLSIGDHLARLLTRQGIGVIHDRQLHDYPSYNDAYVHARSSTQALLEAHPDIRLVLDLHRDAAGTPGNQLRTLVQSEGQPCAQLMLVLGTGSGSRYNSRWEENLALALKLQLQLESLCPGITRPISLRPQRFNLDLSPGALLVEVGAAGNTREEALRSVQILARAIASLARGANIP